MSGGAASSPERRSITAHDELRALGQRYARAADERDVEVLASLFHPDAEISGARGVQGVASWLDAFRAPRSFPTSMHVLGDPLIELDEPAGEGTLDTYAVVYQLGDPASAQADLTLGIRYLDTVVRHDGHWVIRARTARTMWMR